MLWLRNDKATSRFFPALLAAPGSITILRSIRYTRED